MCGFGNCVDKWTIEAQVYPDSTYNSTYFPAFFILYFSTDVNFQTIPNLVWCIILHTLYYGVSLDHLQTVNSVPHIRSFSTFHFLSRLMEQYNVLSF